MNKSISLFFVNRWYGLIVFTRRPAPISGCSGGGAGGSFAV